MTDLTERHRRLRDVFDGALQREPGASREDYLATACAGDADLHREVVRLLAAHTDANAFLEHPSGAVAFLGDVIEPVDDSEEVPAGTVIGPYRIDALIAHGGMGSVYRATDLRLRRTVALKLMGRDAADGSAQIDRFVHEARVTASLDHANVVRAYDVGSWDSRPYLITELLDGETLRDRLTRGPLTVDQTVRIAIDLSSGLIAAHAAGLVHRDLKPENVILTAAGPAKIVDFGIAKLADDDVRRVGPATVKGVLYGTVGYLAPEQVSGSAVDARTDLFALGSILFEALIGTRPFAREHTIDTLHAILHETVPDLRALRPDVPPALVRLVARLLEKTPASRVQTAAEVHAALQHLSTPAGNATLRRRLPRRWRQALTAAIGLAAVIALLLFSTRRPPALTERDSVLVADFVNATQESVFDGTLRQALTIDLEQSPFLSIISRQRISKALALMKRAPDKPVIGDVAREVCQRLGAAIAINGHISLVGTRYLLALEAANCRTGDRVASDREEAPDRDHVLKALDASSSRLRRKLGESRGTLQRFATPIEEATTSSLEALKAFHAGEEARQRLGDLAVLPFYQRAAQIDPEFAMAYAKMSVISSNLGRFDDAARLAQQAAARASRVSEIERLYIEGRMCASGPRVDECARDVHEIWKRTYPRDPTPYANLCVTYMSLGRFDEAALNCRESLRLDPNSYFSHSNLVEVYIILGRVREAFEIDDLAASRGIDDPSVHVQLFDLAYALGDKSRMATERRWATGRPEECVFVSRDSEILASAGRMSDARTVRAQAIAIAERTNKPEALRIQARGAYIDAAVGNEREARAALAGIPSTMTAAVIDGAIAAGLVRDRRQAERFLRLPTAGLPSTARSTLETVAALIDIDSGNRAALARVPPPAHGDLMPYGPSLRPIYVRGIAYLHAGAAAQAIDEFQRIVDHPANSPYMPFHALARVQQARAYVMAGNLSKARRSYEEFFSRWKDADPDVPILKEARAEYTRLPR